MIDLFVKRPAMAIVFVLVFVILGVFSYRNLIIESTPKIDFPIVSISTVYPGATSIEIETQIIKKIEDAISEISDIKSVNGIIRDNFGMVMIEFNLQVDVNIKAIEVKDKIEQIINDFPVNAKKPVVAKFAPLVIPIQELILSSSEVGGKELFQIADKVIKPQLSTVSGVASVDIAGGQIRQINIQADRNLLQKHFVTMSDIASALTAKNMNVPSGEISSGESELSVRFQGEFANLDEIRNMPIVTHDGIELKLSQIATVEDSFKKREKISQFNGKEAVSLSINKLSDGDAVNVAKNIHSAVAQINQRLPQNVQLEVVFDSTKRVVADTQATITNIWLGVVLTVVILFMFLGNLSITFIAAIVIPTSIISTFLLMDFSHFTINMMSLLAIATALGTLIANAIVIIETVVKKMDAGQDSINAAIDGTKEIFVAVLASTGTNLVVFTPIAFMGGIVGQFMKQFGLTVVYATIFSLLASFTLTPMLCALVFRNYRLQSGNKTESFVLMKILRRMIVAPTNYAVNFLLREIKIVFDLIFRYPKTTIFISLLACCSPVLITSYLGNEFTAQVDQDIVRVKVEMPQGTSLQKTKQVVDRIEEIVKRIPEMTSYLSLIGGDGVENATTIINLKKREERSKSDVGIINELIPQMATIPDAKITFAAGEGHGPGSMGDITINVYGADYQTLLQLADQVQKIMQDSSLFRSISSSHKHPKNEIVFLPDAVKMQQLGIKNTDVANLLRMAIAGDDRSIYREQGEEYRINITLGDDFKSSVDDVGRLYVSSRGGLVPLASLGEIIERPSLPPVKRRDKQRIIEISGYLAKSTAGAVEVLLKKDFQKIDFPQGYGFHFAGKSEYMAETTAEIAKAFLMAVILTYLLLVAITNSFVHPFTIIFSVFTSLSGVLYLLYFTEFSINVGSMMAIVMLVGLVVNNAILLLDKVISDRHLHPDVVAGLWAAINDRFRPIAMTTIAVIVGTIPQLFDPNVVKASMGAVIIGGMLSSTLFTFVLIPPLYFYVEKFRNSTIFRH